jgi:hypothetical protein
MIRYLYVVLLLGLLLNGCNPRLNMEPPKTYPVSGEIIDTGGRVVAGTLIQFEPANPEFRSQAKIDPAGKFRLNLLFGNEQLDGAVEGSHKITILYPLDMVEANGTDLIVLEKPCVVQPGENHFPIKLPPRTK